MAADALALSVALICAVVLRYDALSTSEIADHLAKHLVSSPFVLAVYVLIFAAMRLYRHAWRFASLETLWSVIYANTLGLLSMVVLQFVLDDREIFRPSVLFIFWLLSIAFVGGLRVLLRLARIPSGFGGLLPHQVRADAPRKRIVIVGAGALGVALLRALQEDASVCYDIIGFLDDAPEKQGTYIRNVPVVGPLSHLQSLVRKSAVDEVLIAISGISGPRIREHVIACRRQGIPVKVVPGFDEMLNGKLHLHLEDFSVEDLLRRQPVRIKLEVIAEQIRGKRVLITGAGGSIGSELCRQISAMGPSKLILLGHGENSMHRLYNELIVACPELRDRYCMAIGSVADPVRVNRVFRDHRPQIVFHAAAHKHVPIMESNVCEAVKNNVLGTHRIAEACGVYQVERMVLVSTDKAVYPSSVMGATKWLCEEVLRSLSERYPTTVFLTARFGNVLDSRGSVLPLFREQVGRGGPVTITDPEVTRFFMTIREAVQLVLQAATIGRSGELFVLDMGQPVRIIDLANDMIRLSGFEPEVDIPIVFTGLRPGEKLHERLSADDEDVQPAACEGLFVVQRPRYFRPDEFARILRRLAQLTENGDDQEAITALELIVPGFAHRKPIAADVAEAVN